MKIFLDTANINDIKKGVAWGIVDGVTTNPTLISREGFKDYKSALKDICDIVKGPISAEVISTDSEGMIKEGKNLSKIDENIVIKIPATFEGLKAVKQLTNENIKTNVTLIFSPSQALLAAKAGATYVSPFVGRLDDISSNGMELVEKIVAIFDNYLIDTKVIVASIRHPLHFVESALIGAEVATVPFPVLEKLMKHPLTDIGIERFLNDWKKADK
jgi:transaldolase